MITRTELAAMVQCCSDSLAVDGLESLWAPEVPETLPVWTSLRAELLETYLLRLAHSDAGEGPATQGLGTYVDALRAARTDELDEIGWAVAATFYVALSDGTTVHAVTTVARAVWHVEDKTIVPVGADETPLVVQVFGIGDGFNDANLLKNLVELPEYGSGEIDPTSFTSVTAESGLPEAAVVPSVSVLLNAAQSMYIGRGSTFVAIDRVHRRLAVVTEG